MSSDAPPARPGRAGASAQRVYEDERKAWIKRNRRVFRTVDAIVALVIASSFVVWRLWPPLGWYAGLLAGMALCFDLAARMHPPTWIEQWQSGAYGEQRTGRELEKLPPDWLVLHDLRRSNGTNIDHVVIGPPGVFVLDTKNVGSEVRIDGDTLTALRPDGCPRYKTNAPANAGRGSAAYVGNALTQAGTRVWVNALVVVWGDMPQAHVASRHLDWVVGTNLVGWLTGLPENRQPDRIALVRLPSAPGSSSRSGHVARSRSIPLGDPPVEDWLQLAAHRHVSGGSRPTWPQPAWSATNRICRTFRYGGSSSMIIG